MQWIRSVFGTKFIMLIIILLAAVFVFYGVFSPKATRGMHEGAVAGTVNGAAISRSEFSREYNQQVESIRNMMGGQSLSREQLKAFGIGQRVLERLQTRKLMVQEAERIGLLPGEAEIKNQIMELPYFKKDGKFDLTTYKNVLQSNNMTPASFEKSVREDMSTQKWSDYFRSHVKASDEEVRRQFLLEKNRRNIKYVLLTEESGKKGMKISDEDVAKYLGDKTKESLVRASFDARKDTDFKGKTFDGEKNAIAREMLLRDRYVEVAKLNEKVAAEVLGMLSSDKAPKNASDAKVNEFLKPYGVEVKTTGWVTEEKSALPGVGEAPELFKDAFADVKEAKKYNLGSKILVARVMDEEKPNMDQWEKVKDSVADTVLEKKRNEVWTAWMKRLRDTSSLEVNKAVVDGEGD